MSFRPDDAREIALRIIDKRNKTPRHNILHNRFPLHVIDCINLNYTKHLGNFTFAFLSLSFQLECQVLHVILQYFLVCNYFWMFCEGLYLHTILVFAFVDKQSIMKSLYLIGWGKYLK